MLVVLFGKQEDGDEEGYKDDENEHDEGDNDDVEKVGNVDGDEVSDDLLLLLSSSYECCFIFVCLLCFLVFVLCFFENVNTTFFNVECDMVDVSPRNKLCSNFATCRC